MTYRDLRRVLYKIDNEQLTVKQLRQILFEEIEQDKEIDFSKYSLLINGKKI